MTSCSNKLYPFTDNVYDELGSSSSALSKVQFYLSSDIVLYRDFGGKSTSVENGSIKIVDGRKIEEVIFRKGTPGVFVFSPDGQELIHHFCYHMLQTSYLLPPAAKTLYRNIVMFGQTWLETHTWIDNNNNESIN